MKKRCAFLASVALLSLLVGTIANLAAVHGWSNGGFSADPNNPNYGTHDWIAQHSLDWQFPIPGMPDLPLEAYLYGTELPDRSPPEGVGDTANHHVYYFANGSLQDDVSAVRAQQEYDKAVGFFRAGNLVEAAKRLGMMTHYIADVAVFGHVMGSSTDWGSETHHSDYEDYVNERTNAYDDEFNTFLVFDGNLSVISAYNATLTLAYDTTFDVDGIFTCAWMDQNYNWSNPTFKNRCGESLNLAVNLIADVIRTFSIEVMERRINVPFYYQEERYYCGPAALQMVFDFYGENISQVEIADVARTVGPPLSSTFTDELRRAAHFSNVSTSMGSEMPENITGYAARKLGYATFERGGMTLDELKALIDMDFPIILLMRWVPGEEYGHYRVTVGYNETHVFLHDPWNNIAWGGDYGGPNLAMNHTFFLDMWSYSGFWGLFVSPWKITFIMPSTVYVGESFTVAANVTYPCPSPFSTYDYSALACCATITLSQGFGLAEGENATKNLGDLQARGTAQVSWTVKAGGSGNCSVTVEAGGIIDGFIGGKSGVGPAYNYNDRIGGCVSSFVTALEDGFPPDIGVPSQEPSRDVVMPFQNVTVCVNITDVESGVENATLYYDLNNSSAWTAVSMGYDSTSGLYNGSIPGQPEWTWVKFKIVAYDFAGNNATRDGVEVYCTYQVVPEFSSCHVLLLLVILALSVVLCVRRRVYSRCVFMCDCG